MPLREFSRLTDRLMAHLGDEAVLREAYNTRRSFRCNVEHGVEFADPNDQAIFTRSVSTIGKEYFPEVGDTLTTYDDTKTLVTGRWRLDRLLRDNGYSRQFVLLGI